MAGVEFVSMTLPFAPNEQTVDAALQELQVNASPQHGNYAATLSTSSMILTARCYLDLFGYRSGRYVS